MVCTWRTATVIAGIWGTFIAGPAFAASDVSNSGTASNHATASVASSVASTQSSSIISSAATGGFTAGSGGFTPSSSGGSGGFAPSGGGSGGFAPSGGGSSGGSGGSGGSDGSGGSSGGGSGGFSPDGNGSDGKPQSSNQPGNFGFRMQGKAAGADEARTGMWAQGLTSYIDKSEAAMAMRGTVYNVLGGIDHKITDNLTSGLSLGYEDVNLKTRYNNGTYRSQGVTVAPYVGYALNSTWSADASVGFTWLDNTTSRNDNAVAGKFDGGRAFASTNLVGGFAYGNWRFQPRVGLFYMHENQNAYTDSSGGQNTGNHFAQGSLSAGGKIGYAFGSVVPYAKVLGEWDFLTPDASLKSNGEMSNVDRFGGTAGLGAEIYSGNFVGSLEADYGAIGRKDLDVWALIARVRYSF